MRPTKLLAEAYGVVTRTLDSNGKRIVVSVHFDSEVQVGGLLELESGERTMEQADDPIILNPDIKPEVKKRVMLVFYNQQLKVFYERPVILPEQYTSYRCPCTGLKSLFPHRSSIYPAFTVYFAHPNLHI